MFELVDSAPQSAVIKVIGVGGGGGNAVEHMVWARRRQCKSAAVSQKVWEPVLILK